MINQSIEMLEKVASVYAVKKSGIFLKSENKSL
jgi:hypothetical protein